MDEKDIYDKYIVEFYNFMMKIVDAYEIKEIVKDDVGEKIIYKSSFSMELNNYIYQNPKKIHRTKDFAPLLININLHDLKLTLSEEQILFLINYLENLMRTIGDFERQELFESKKIMPKIDSMSPSKDDNKNKNPDEIPNIKEDIKEKKEEIKIDEEIKKEENKKEEDIIEGNKKEIENKKEDDKKEGDKKEPCRAYSIRQEKFHEKTTS